MNKSGCVYDDWYWMVDIMNLIMIFLNDDDDL